MASSFFFLFFGFFFFLFFFGFLSSRLLHASSSPRLLPLHGFPHAPGGL